MTQPSLQQAVQKQQPVLINQLDNLTYNTKQLIRNQFLLSSIEDRIKTAYMNYQVKPMHFCSYAGFAKTFSYPNKEKVFKQQNLNIIDVHLRYHQYVHEKMAIYKWVPSLAFVVATKFHPLGLLFPLIFTKAVDRYFKDFFIWKHSSQKIINIRSQFITKLCKNKNKLRRVMLYDQLRQDLAKSESEIPVKYIKFGQNTKYIFHTTVKDIEQSSIYLTPMFQNFIKIRTLSTNSLSDFINHFIELKNDYLTYRKQMENSQLPPYSDYQKFTKFKDIRKEELYNPTKQIQLRIQRWLEIIKFYKTGNFFISGFSLVDALNLNKQYDLLSPQKFNYETNYPDLCIFYGIVLTGKLLTFIIKRAARM